MIGQTLSHFRITAKLGSGGMGDVWQAEDTKLGRQVAIKILPQEVAGDPERLARFEREARVLASLNHPHIAAIYEVDEADDVHFLVMELAEGETLAERISQGALPLDETLPLALQIAEALEAAHDKGIIHRDLKPANIKISLESQIKVLDFGLAKALDAHDLETPKAQGLSVSPTLTAQMTTPGVLLGTAAYMSPEQARGQEVDKRADIWAFGCVLLEMLTGRSSFAGDTVSDTLAAVLRAEPKWDDLPSDTPPPIRRLLHRCLEKDSNRRLRDIGEARIVIEDTLSGVATDEPAQADPQGRSDRMWAPWLGLVASAAIGAAAVWMLMPEPLQLPLRKLDIAVEDLIVSNFNRPVLSPDGTKIVYTSGGDLWVRELDQLEAHQLPETQGAMYVSWSPDSRFIAYVAGLKLWRIAADGSESKVIAALPSHLSGAGGTVWLPDGRIVLSGSDKVGLLQVSSHGGDPTPLLELDSESERDFHELAQLPEDRGLLFTVHRASWSTDTIGLLTGDTRKNLLTLAGEDLQTPAYSPSGHLLYYRASTTPGIWAIPFSLTKLDIIGEPFLVAGDSTQPSVAADGTLAFVSGVDSTLNQLVWVGRDGQLIEAIGQPMSFLSTPTISPDGGLALTNASHPNEFFDIWIHDLTRGTQSRLTFDRSIDVFPVWSPDGQDFAYEVKDSNDIVLKQASGAGQPRVLVKGRSPSWSPDGRYLIFNLEGEGTGEDLWYLQPARDEEPVLLLQTAAAEKDAQISPDGRYIAYVSDESDREEVYVMPFPRADGKWQVSVNGGTYPRWSRSGSELFFVQDVNLMAVEVDLGPPLQLGQPKLLFSAAASGLDIMWRGYDVAPDEERFLMVRRAQLEESSATLNVVQNWYAEFEENP